MTFCSVPLLVCICLTAFTAEARANCARRVLAHQRQDPATILRLETACTVAYLTGDTEFERCLLTPDFTEIMSSGSINHLGEELALARKNNGKTLAGAAPMPSITVHMHGGVAVAYGISDANFGIDSCYRSSTRHFSRGIGDTCSPIKFSSRA